MKYTVIGLAVAAGLYLLHRLAQWAEHRGWIYYRKARGSSGTLGNAFLEVQQNFEPSKRYVLEENLREKTDEAEQGDPPLPDETPP